MSIALRVAQRAIYQGLARQLTEILQRGGYSQVQAKPFDRGVTINLSGERDDWVVMDSPPIGTKLPGYLYFGPIPVQEHKAFVWVENPEDRDKPRIFKQILQAAQRQAPGGYR